MRKLLFYFAIAATLILTTSCSNSSKPQGQLVGIYSPNIPESVPYGMVHIPRGSVTIGPNDPSASWAIQPQQKTVTVEAFWMDVTEITNGEYHQFVNWVRDSITRTELTRMEVDLGIEAEEAKYFKVKYNPFDESAEPDTFLNWNVPIPWNTRWIYEGDEEENAVYLAVNKIFSQPTKAERGKQLKSHLMNYSYTWLNLDQAKLPGNAFNPKTGSYDENATVKIDTAYIDENGHIINKTITKKLRSREDLIAKKIINIYPDTMCWMTEFTYSYNEPAMLNYFSHPSYGMFPVVGITWEQAQAFCHWRTEIYNNLSKMPRAQKYRLPTEAEWEYAARGGRENAQYPWGGPYIRDAKGCFMANFKPMRGNYVEDGFLLPAKVGSYKPNDFGLYDMAGNVAEWTNDTYDPTMTTFTLDMNPSYSYDANSDDPKIMKKRIIKGGSWKDVGVYLQCGMRDFEYQDKSRSSIGFRCVRSSIGK